MIYAIKRLERVRAELNQELTRVQESRLDKRAKTVTYQNNVKEIKNVRKVINSKIKEVDNAIQVLEALLIHNVNEIQQDEVKSEIPTTEETTIN